MGEMSECGKHEMDLYHEAGKPCPLCAAEARLATMGDEVARLTHMLVHIPGVLCVDGRPELYASSMADGIKRDAMEMTKALKEEP
jgi:hypothetical protein